MRSVPTPVWPGLAAVAFLTATAAGQTYVEDFESDTTPGQGGFATAVFEHATMPNEISGTGPASAGIVDWDSVSPDHSLFLALATDAVTFDLPGGAAVDYASVWMKGYGAIARFRVIGSNGTAFIDAPGDGSWVFADTTNMGVGTIFEIRLTGFEAAFDDLTIRVHTGCNRGDANCDGALNFFDIDPFVMALFDGAAYRALFCGGSICTCDIDRSGAVDFFDIDPFLACLFATCPP